MNKTKLMIMDIIKEELASDMMPGAPIGIAADAILSAIPDIIRSMVKPLEWENTFGDWKIDVAVSEVLGEYSVFDNEGKCSLTKPGQLYGEHVQGNMDDARAAANEHRLSLIMKELGLDR